jgi:iron(III) transport system ATP-binding protein
VQAGSPRELYLQPRTAMLAKFLGDALLIDGMVQGGETDTPLGRVRVGRATPDGPARVMLRPEQIRLVSWSEGTPTAEIVSASFEGPITMVTFRAGGSIFTLKVPSADAPLQGRASIVLIGTGHVIPVAG